MREDARSLLERLSRKDFRYQEFADPFADMELWPIFEALLTDERVVGSRASSIRMADIQFKPAAPRPQPAAPAKPTQLFAQYAGKTAAPSTSPTGDTVVNMRQFFGRLSDKN